MRLPVPHCLAFVLCLSPIARAQTVAPQTVPIEPHASAEPEPASAVDFTWDETPGATSYIITVAKDPAFQNTVTTIDSAKAFARSQPLQPGAYFWIVEAFNDTGPLHRSQPKPLVVGAPYKVSVESRVPLPMPQTLLPLNDALFAPNSKIRLAWSAVPGAKQYLVRIWDENKPRRRDSQDDVSHPRWETVVQQPWIVVHDAPYTSFMYLDSGKYRWDVSGLNSSTQQTGAFASGSFEMHKKKFLKPNTFELLGRLSYLAAFSRHRSAEQSTAYHFNNDSRGVGAGIEWWMGYEWGLRLLSDFYDVGFPLPLVSSAAEARYRRKLTNSPNAWRFELGFGVEFLQLPIAEFYSVALGSTINELDGIGPVVEPAFVYRFESPVQWKAGLRLGMPLLLITNGGGGSHLDRGMDIHFFNEFRWFCSTSTWLGGELSFFFSEIKATPNTVVNMQSSASYIGSELKGLIGFSL